MASTTRYTYNITSQNNDLDRNNSYYTYNNYNNYDNTNNNNLYSQNQNNSFLNQTTPLIYKEDNNSNLNNITYNVNRFNRLHSRLDEINEKINRDKDEKENYIHNKITTTEMILDNNNEIRARKIKEIKTSIRGLSALFEQIKNFSKESNSQSNEILENFENKFNMRLKQELRNAKMNVEIVKNNDAPEVTNVDIIRRLSRLEKLVYGAGSSERSNYSSEFNNEE